MFPVSCGMLIVTVNYVTLIIIKAILFLFMKHIQQNTILNDVLINLNSLTNWPVFQMLHQFVSIDVATYQQTVGIR